MKPTQQNRIESIRGMEPLERRMMLDGDVTAFIRGGDLIIRGDSEDNQILITQEDGVVIIEGDETTVNGEESVELPLFTRDLLIQMQQGGEDEVAIQGPFEVARDLRARLKAGEFLVEGSAEPVEVGRDLSVQTGPDGIAILRNNVVVGDDVTIKSGEAQVVAGLAHVPDFDAAEFDDSLTIDNPYFPLVPGTVYTYEAEGIDDDTDEVTTEEIIVEVLPDTRTILGVEARVVRDRVFEDGLLIEDTFDWYAQDNNGNVWYMGEDSTSFEYDDDGNLIETTQEGSWEAGVDDAQAGVIMEAQPRIGYRYYQEFGPGNVLDQAHGVATGETVTVPVGTFNDVYRTEEIAVVEPFGLANKLYAPGLGTIQEFDFDIEDNEVIQTTTLISVELNGVPVTQVLPPNGFVGTNADGTLVGGIEIGDDLSMRSKDAAIVLNAEIGDKLTVTAKEELVIVDATVGGKATISTGDTISLRRVFSDSMIRAKGNPDDIYIFESEIATFKVAFGRGDNTLAVGDSIIDVLDANGGKGTNTFEDLEGNDFGTLKLKKFVEA